MPVRVALVTGSNRGIGFCVVKGLCERFDGVVYLTSRDPAKGLLAVEKLSNLGLQPKYHQLDITDQDSVMIFAKHLQENYGEIDLIVNNAGEFFIDSPIITIEQAKTVVDVNYFGLKRVGHILFPLLRRKARVVNINSNNGHSSSIPNEILVKKLTDPNISQDQLDQIVYSFLDDVRNKKLTESEVGCRNYESRFSKNAAYVLTVLQSKELSSRNISVNAVHPGYCKTDASKHLGTMTADEGANSILYAALNAPQQLSGKYIWCNNDIVDWYDYSIPCAEMLYCTKDDPTPYPNQIVPENKRTDVLLKRHIN